MCWPQTISTALSSAVSSSSSTAIHMRWVSPFFFTTISGECLLLPVRPSSSGEYLPLPLSTSASGECLRFCPPTHATVECLPFPLLPPFCWLVFFFSTTYVWDCFPLPLGHSHEVNVLGFLIYLHLVAVILFLQFHPYMESVFLFLYRHPHVVSVFFFLHHHPDSVAILIFFLSPSKLVGVIFFLYYQPQLGSVVLLPYS